MKINMFDKLPYFIYINGRKYFINTDFRNMVSFEIRMQDRADTDNNRDDFIYDCLYRFCPSFFREEHTREEILKLNEKFIWFYKCGRENYHKSDGGASTQLDEAMAYEYDDEYIWSAFLEQYNVDLTEVKNLHWWKFKAMLKSLKKDTKIGEIMSYRTYRGKDEDMLSLKNYWALPIKTQAQKHLDETAEMLMKYNKK